MTDTKPSLTEFLLARIAEDEALGLAIFDGLFALEDDYPPTAKQIAQQGRWEREAEAKRRIVEEYVAQEADIEKRHDPDYNDDPWDVGYAGGLGRALELLAQPYAAHPEFRGEWAL